MSLNNTNPTTYSSAILIADTYQLQNGSNDSLPPFSLANGFPVSACLELQSTLGALLVSRMTTTQRDDLNSANGMMIYNTTSNSFNFYEDGGWVQIPGVITPTIQNDIAVFNDTDGTLIDSTVRLLPSTVGNNLFLGGTAGSVSLRNNAIGTTLYGSEVFQTISDATGLTALGCQIGVLATGVFNHCVFVGDAIASNNPIVNLSNITAVGSSCFFSIESTSSLSCGFGEGVMQNATTIVRSVGVGNLAGALRPTYTDAVLLGYGADTNIASFNGVVAVGSSALVGGTNGIAIGFHSSTLGSNAIAIGANSQASAPNAVAIGPSAAADVANAIVLGASGSLVGVNTSSPIANLHVDGTIAYQQPVVVPSGSFPYIAVPTDCFIDCFPTGSFGQPVILPDVDSTNLGRAYYISNSSDGTDVLNIQTVSLQFVQPDIINIHNGLIYIAFYDGVQYGYRGVY